MGDDLIFAQKFTRTAADGLALLVEMENSRAAENAGVVIDMMTTVQRGAKRLRARHIYSGAQGVLSALHHETDTVLHGRIENLGCLVTEYARGLEELLQKPVKVPEKTESEKWHAARETLNGLLPIASTEDADLLSRLMRAPVTLETVQPKHSQKIMESEVIPFLKPETALDIEDSVIEELAIEDPAPPISRDTKSPLRSDLDPAFIVSLESMMRDVIADALSVARVVGRTISLSYDMGNKTVSEAQSEDLRERLGQALSQIIRHSLTQDRIGHIDINLAGEQLHIMAGTTAMRVAINPKHNPNPIAAPRITSEIEQDLKSQLNALTDPGSLHETAS